MGLEIKKVYIEGHFMETEYIKSENLNIVEKHFAERHNSEIDFFLDNNSAKHGNLYHGKKIYPIEILKNFSSEEVRIIIVSEFYDEISYQLQSLGFKEGIHFFNEIIYYTSQIDNFIISYMKCGRTWLRFIIGNMLIKYQDSTEEKDVLAYTDGKYISKINTRIKAYHDDNPHLRKPDQLELDKSRYYDKKILFLVRNPIDVAVSLYYHFTYRSKSNTKPIDEFVSEYIPGIVEYFNIWAKQKEMIKEFLIVRYEDLHKSPLIEMKRISQFFNITLSEEQIQEVIYQSNYKNMRSYEKNSTKNPQLSSNLITEKDFRAAKVRKGVVGGYISELQQKTISKMEMFTTKNLDKSYGYF